MVAFNVIFVFFIHYSQSVVRFIIRIRFRIDSLFAFVICIPSFRFVIRIRHSHLFVIRIRYSYLIRYPLTTLTLSAKAGFHNGRENKSKFKKKDKGSKIHDSPVFFLRSVRIHIIFPLYVGVTVTSSLFACVFVFCSDSH